MADLDLSTGDAMPANDVDKIVDQLKNASIPELDAILAATRKFRPLFDGLPLGTTLAEAGRYKSAVGDPLGIKFMSLGKAGGQ